MEESPKPGIGRRRLLRNSAVIAAAVPPVLAVGEAVGQQAASAAVPSYDPQQRFIRLVGGGGGVIFAIQADGGLYWYRHLGYQTGAASWASGSGRRVGTGWNGFRAVFGGVDGSLYALRGDGVLLYYRYRLSNGTTGVGTWISGGQIGSGFDKYPRVFGFNGDIYGQTSNGDLVLHRWDLVAKKWSVDGLKIGSGFKSSICQADTNGVIYAYNYGDISWYRHQGDGVWATGSGFKIGSGFRNFGLNDGVWFTGQGVLYAIPPDAPAATQTGQLMEYRLTNYLTAGTDNRTAWMNKGSGLKVGSGWTVQTQAALQGYPTTPSVRQGEVVRIAVSTGLPSVSAAMVRLAPAAGAPEAVSQPASVATGVQALPKGYITVGCNWTDRIQFRIPADWQPGLYAAQLSGAYGLRRYVPFVVRPVTPTNKIAVLVPTFTYNAYNSWGGHNQYCNDIFKPRPLTVRRPSTEWNVDDPGAPDHTLWSDLLLTRWMTRQGLAFDCYEDMDLHASGAWLTNYRVIVLTSHPEYWSEAMRQNLVNFQAGGGHVVYAGGNGIYERVLVNSARTVVTYRRTDGKRDYFSDLGLPASQLVGTNYIAAGTYAPFRVTQDHPLLAGTGLIVGSRFGVTGYNKGASGWEVDGMRGLAGEATAAQVIAMGENANGGAAMVFMEKPNGALVFSASSISFAGALASDEAMSTLFRNVFDRMLETGVTVKATEAPMPRTKAVPAVPEPTFME
ncbi:N,N-dimethylformamidase beta subunit family domain-containing protein [Micromonospora sp. NPDC005806]|uniref:N,N-dimethylformamidase beta subunit family domain-containing protein n=1 Tax=Micromonospora sp. NPDC005806 TaxID=3364234 RepID=UPI0036C53D70